MNASKMPPLNVAVFAHGDIVGLVRLDTDRSERDCAEVVSSGFSYCGSIGVNGGEVVVTTEADRETEMLRGGYLFAGLLGEHQKTHQLQETSWTRLQQQSPRA